MTIPTVNDIFVMSGTSGPAHNIVIDGLTFSGGKFTDTFVDSLPDPAGNTSWPWNRTPTAYRHGAIRISNAQSITVQHCYINNVPFCGVVLDGFAQSNVVTSNEIAQFGYYGVLAMGSEVGALDSSNHQIYDSKLNTTSNNYIHDGGLTVGHGSGILMNQSGENQVLHNLIRNLPRYGISLKGDGPSMLGDNGVSSDVYIGGVAVTWANHWDWITSKSNTFKYNDISAVNNYATDTGGVHLHGCGKGNVVDTNRVHDIALPAEFADLNPACSYGIYLDGRSDYTTVQNNIVYGIHGGPGKSPIFVSSTNQQIYNNIFVATFGSAAAISDFVYPTPTAAGAGKHNYQHNIVMCKGGVQPGQWGVRDNARGALITFYGNPGFGYSNNWKTSTSAADPVDRVVASDYNLFWDLAGMNSVEGIHGDKWPVGGNPYDTLTAWKALFSNLYDQHSQTGDPLFTNPTAGDFSVASGRRHWLWASLRSIRRASGSRRPTRWSAVTSRTDLIGGHSGRRMVSTVRALVHNAYVIDVAQAVPIVASPSPSLADIIITSLRSAIIAGALPAGHRLRERDLSTLFQCSSTPVREALHRLEGEGLVKVHQRRGVEVTSLSVTEVEDMYELRIVLECYAAAKAARSRPSTEALAEAAGIVAKQLRGSDDSGLDPLDAEFHRALTALARNEVVANTVERTTRQIEAVQARVKAVVAGGRTKAAAAHEQILAAVAEGKPQRAEKLMREHLGWACEAVLTSIHQSNAP